MTGWRPLLYHLTKLPSLFLPFFVRGLFAAPVAKLRKLNFALYFLLIFTAPIIRPLARRAL